MKTEKQTINSTCLVSGRCGRLVEGKGRETDSVSLVPFSFCQPPTYNWQKKVELIVCFSVLLLYLAWKRGLPRKCAHFVLFHPIKKRSFNLSCVLDLFWEPWQSTLFQIFLHVSRLGAGSTHVNPQALTCWHRLPSFLQVFTRRGRLPRV